MKTNYLIVALTFVSLLVQACGQKTEPKSTIMANAESDYPFAFDELVVTGDVSKDYEKENLAFDLMIGDESSHYTIKGSVGTAQGNLNTDLNFSSVRVLKYTLPPNAARHQVKSLKNSGTLRISVRKRHAMDLTLADVPVSGYFLQGKMDDGVWFDGLAVDAEKSVGCLDYNRFNGHYNSKGGCSFGSCKISTSTKKGKCTMDFDDSGSFPANAMTYNLAFDKLLVTGLVHFKDTKNGSKIVATLGKFALTIKKDNGSKIFLAEAINPESEDEKLIRKLIAFIELTVFDFWAD